MPDLLVADRESDFGEELGNIRTRRNIWGNEEAYLEIFGGDWGNIRTRRNLWGNEEAYLEIFGGDWGNIRTRRRKERVVIPRWDARKGLANHQLNKGRNHHLKARVCLTKFFLVNFILLFLKISVFGGI